MTIQTNQPNTHYCTSHRDGDWTVFKCPLCPKYERRINLISGKSKVVGFDANVRHTGIFDGQNASEVLAQTANLNLN